MDEYAIRLARSDDVAVLPSVEKRATQLFRSCLPQTGAPMELLEDVTTVDELSAAQARDHLWVAVSPDGSIVGFAQVEILDGDAHLDEVDVVPEHGGKGIGSRFVQTVCDWTKGEGYERVTLSTFRDVPWNAPFYERRGFVPVQFEHLRPQHISLVNAERARGLRTDLRVVMEYRL